MKRKTFYLLTFTWGLPLTLCGLLTAAALLAVGHRPRRWHGCLHFELGRTRWGGLNLGPVLLTQRQPPEELVAHELGHALQNCFFGPSMLVFVLCSAIRYHYINYLGSRGKITPLYHAWWFEGQATKLGLNISNYGGEIMGIDWKRKLTSRKLWMALAGFVAGLILAFDGSAEVAETVSGCIMSGASVIAYVLGEGLTDAANK